VQHELKADTIRMLDRAGSNGGQDELAEPLNDCYE
jgi:hypothetical protein